MDGSSNTPFIMAVIGASGSGKSWYVKQQIRGARPERLLIWDARSEYGEIARPVHTLGEVLRAARSGKPFRLAYRPSSFDRLAEQFEALCKIAFALGNCTFVVEELSDVTKPSYAPPGWRRISTQGRHRGMRVYGTAQRPALMDKSFLGNCTDIRCGRLAYDPDARLMALNLRVHVNEVSALAGHDWIHRSIAGNTLTRSRDVAPTPQKRSNSKKNSAR